MSNLQSTNLHEAAIKNRPCRCGAIKLGFAPCPLRDFNTVSKVSKICSFCGSLEEAGEEKVKVRYNTSGQLFSLPHRAAKVQTMRFGHGNWWHRANVLQMWLQYKTVP